MAEELGSLSFSSWVRRGLAAGITATEDDVVGPTTRAEAQLLFGPNSLDATALLDLVGPGDIAGLDSRVVVRTSPRANDLDAEYLQYALIECDQADLPWRYTPAQARGDVGQRTDQLRPWVTLVVLEVSEGSVAPPTASQRLPVLTTDASNLPHPDDLWAWAHTQLEGDNVDDNSTRERIQGEPGLFVARLVSPRLLKQRTSYIAMLVPTFERGRKAGLGETLDQNVGALQGAWETSGEVKLPVYYQWEFTTGTVGSFEQVARLIKARVVPKSVGRRGMDASQPGLELPPAALGSLPAEGALLSVAAFEDDPPEWPEVERTAWIEALSAFLNQPELDLEGAGVARVVAPPLYGQWYAEDDTLNDPIPDGDNPPWFHQLNSDPRNRVGAALGTKVIQREQQELLASGWDQVDELPAINNQLRSLQMGRSLLNRFYLRHIITGHRQTFWNLTYRLHARIRCGDKSVCERTDSSPIVPGFLSAQWRRFSRPRGFLGRRQGRPQLTGLVPNLLDKLNNCERPAPEPPPPSGIFRPGDIYVNLTPGGISCELTIQLRALGSRVLVYWGLVIMWVARQLLVSDQGNCWWLGIKALKYGSTLIQLAIYGLDVDLRCKWQAGTLTVEDVLGSRPLPTYVGSFGMPTNLPFPSLPGGVGALDSSDAAALRAALADVLRKFLPPPDLSCPPPMDIDTCDASIRTQLVPEVTLSDSITKRITLDFPWAPEDPLEPIFAAPDYEQPMYRPLADISHDWILPGLNKLKMDSVGLVVTNQKFVESYMTGLNHEMTRELLWNEFPTDQRGTYFRQFWDVAGHISEEGSPVPPEQLRDIKPMRLWESEAGLGDNSPRPPLPEGAARLVLVVRAQLIRKYPNVIVYAQRAEMVDGSPQLTGEEKHPVFYALLEPEVAFYGFDLTPDDIRDNPEWYFVLQEQPGEPQFSEDAANRDNKDYSRPNSLSLQDGTTSAESSATLAYKTFQQPFRLGIQGTRLLPEG